MYIESIAVGNIQVFRIINHNHPGLCPGDILLIDECGIEQCEDKTFLLVDYAGKRVLKQKHSVGAIIRRAGIHAVGFERRDHIKFVGRVIGWLHR
jgi:hypothetical protein